jgi:tetratricopeptide (TPR) repeat protein
VLLESSNHELPVRKCFKTYPSQPLLRGNLAVFLQTCLVFVLVFELNAWAEEAASPQEYNTIFFQANNLYREEQYDAAIQEYEKLINAGLRSANIFYNLGNCYLRTGSRGSAILYYERAFRMRPRDADIRSNLDFARTLVEGSAGGYNRRWYSMLFLFLRAFLSSGEMTLLVSVLYFIAMASLILSIPFKVQRRLFYYLAAVFLILFIVVLPSFISSVYESEFQKKAVIMVKEADVRFEPNDDATVHFKLHEGAVIQVTRTQNGWNQIRRNDGKMGWLKGDVFAAI